MKQFIKVAVLSKDFFSGIEFEEDMIIGSNQISAIYDKKVAIGESVYLKLTPESMESLKEYIECEDCTGKKNKGEGFIKYPNDMTFLFDGVTKVTDELLDQMRAEGEEEKNE